MFKYFFQKPDAVSTLRFLVVSTLELDVVSMLKFDVVTTLKSDGSSITKSNIFQRRFNVESRRCFNVETTSVCLLGYQKWIFYHINEFLGFQYISIIFKVLNQFLDFKMVYSPSFRISSVEILNDIYMYRKFIFQMLEKYKSNFWIEKI